MSLEKDIVECQFFPAIKGKIVLIEPYNLPRSPDDKVWLEGHDRPYLRWQLRQLQPIEEKAEKDTSCDPLVRLTHLENILWNGIPLKDIQKISSTQYQVEVKPVEVKPEPEERDYFVVYRPGNVPNRLVVDACNLGKDVALVDIKKTADYPMREYRAFKWSDGIK
jgi:hypothetical protein